MADSESDVRRPSADIVAGAEEIRQKTQERIESKRGEKRGFFSRFKKKKKEQDVDSLKAEMSMDEHKVTIEELFARFSTDLERGLTSDVVRKRQETEGRNALTPPKSKPEWLKLVEQMTGFFALLLWTGSALCFVGYALKGELDNLYLGIVLALVVTITGIFSYLQEAKSSNLMDSFKNMMPSLTTCVRDGVPSKIDATGLVRGDIIKLKGGDKVPADVRVLECSDDMKVDNASLTGESEAQKREPKCTHENPLETRNLCFFGTLIPAGTATCVVVNIGDNTVMGRIAALSLATENVETPIAKEIEHFVLIVSAVAIILGISFFVIGFALGTDWLTNLVFMIGIIVANVPEGLLATVTVCLTLTAKRMHAKSVLVKNLEGVETLGSTSCICSDKTGTLTQNIMTVAQIVYDTKIWNVESTMASADYNDQDPSFIALQRVSALCNTAVWNQESKFERDQTTGEVDTSKPLPFQMDVVLGDGSTERKIMWQPIGDASESAMIKFVQASKDIAEFRAQNPLNEKGKIPFNSANKYQAHVNWVESEGSYVVCFKGAPERVTARCANILLNGEVVPFTDELRSQIDALQTQLSRQGMRVLGFAEKKLDIAEYPRDYAFNSENTNFPIGEPEAAFQAKVDLNNANGGSPEDGPNERCKTPLTYIGMMALIDPPRPQVPGAVELCKTAGIKVIMVTGDHPETACAIAKKVGIIWADTKGDIELRNAEHGLVPGSPGYEDPDLAPAIVVPGWDISVDTPVEIWDDILQHSQVVFARTSPQQKLIIVENCQRRRHVVAVTGDGVNDSPALKKADIGVAMGIMGTDVSKEAADMILLDDNFASIVNGVEEGRLIFDNLKKSIAYTLSSNIPEIAPFISFILVQIPLPLSTVLILCVDLGTDMVPAISMAWENPEADIMRRNPRDADVDRLVTKKLVVFAYLQIGVIQCISGFYTYMTVLNDYGFPPDQLPGLGAVDAWGKQTLYCELEHGAWLNFYGESCPCFAYASGLPVNTSDVTSLDPTLQGLCANSASNNDWYENPYHRDQIITNCQQLGFSYWDPDQQLSFLNPNTNTIQLTPRGSIKNCDFAVKDLHSSEGDAPANFNYQNFMTYFSPNSKALYLGGNALPGLASQSSQNAIRKGLYYYEYQPYKSVTSPFFDRRWQQYNTLSDNNDVRGLREDVNEKVFFQFQPVGTWNLISSSLDISNSATMGHISNIISLSTQTSLKTSADGDGLWNPQYTISENVYTNAWLDQTHNQGFLSTNTMSNAAFDSFISTNLASYGLDIADLSTDTRNSIYKFLQQSRCVYEEAGTLPNFEILSSTPNPAFFTAWASDASPGSGTCLPAVNGDVLMLNIASREMQAEALAHAQCASFIGIIIVQWADLVICKTRWLSIRQQGMLNPVMNFALIFELLLGGLLCYVSAIGTALGTRNLRFTHWFPAMPFSIFIVIYDEIRKYLMRRSSLVEIDKATGRTLRTPGWLERNSYY